MKLIQICFLLFGWLTLASAQVFTFSPLAPTVAPVATVPTTMATTTTTRRPITNTSYGLVYPYSYTGNTAGVQQQVLG